MLQREPENWRWYMARRIVDSLMVSQISSIATCCPTLKEKEWDALTESPNQQPKHVAVVFGGFQKE
jgi:hypothetical protein